MIEHARVLKSGDTFAVFGPVGDIDSASSPGLGLYHRDTRFCSRFMLRLEGGELLLRRSAITDDNAHLVVDLGSAEWRRSGGETIPAGAIQVSRRKFLQDSACYERLLIRNTSDLAVDFSFELEFDADYVDLFEVRGMKRQHRGRHLPAQSKGAAMEFAYEGLDRRLRKTSVLFEPAPTELRKNRAKYMVHLDPGAEAIYDITICCEPSAVPPLNYMEAAAKQAGALKSAKASQPTLSASNEKFDAWLDRSLADLRMMQTETPYGPYPYAGLPWYNTAFGRDGIITAFECLWLIPDVARGVLSYLAATQASEENTQRDAQPGKILHETRSGEMAVLGEVPFDRYYGSIDATPLFVMLAGAYHDRTGDLEFIRSIWSNIERALNWIDSFGDCDGDGFIEYAGSSLRGLRNQGWKDSDEAVFHADGTRAEGPIAMCEVQAYVYAAKLAVAKLARLLERESLTRDLADQAETLRRQFEEAFWCEEISTYGLALDGRKRVCCVRSSNAGHCLFAGIASDDRARRLAVTLLSDELFSGWGVRTIGANEVRYDPRSYHNGSIWPHDNAIIAAGLARYGLARDAARIFTGLFDATSFFESHRLPELFCGFPRQADQGPTLCPVSCSPQTWSSCAIFLLLEAFLGLKIDASKREIAFTNPSLPEFLPELEITRLRNGEALVDLRLTRQEKGVLVEVLRREGEVNVVVSQD